jgi:anti-sigma regulatory factor (Ser/Thr protein kinase)
VTTPFRQPPPGAAAIAFTTADHLAAVRDFVGAHALAAGLAPDRVNGLRLAVSEIVTNTLRHTEGGGVMRVWSDGDAVISELTDAGTFQHEIVRPVAHPATAGGWGLFITGKVCDEFLCYSQPGITVWRLVLSRQRNRADSG